MINDDRITGFFGEYRFLSNFYPCLVDYEGITYRSVEHAYVAAKTNNAEMRKKISLTETPGAVKKLGKQLTLRENWESIKISIMTNLCTQKFQNQDLKNKLMETFPRELIEGNNWGDKFWGESPLGNGQNHLGKILMGIRNQAIMERDWK